MAEEMSTGTSDTSTVLFNSALETGVRTVVVLEAFYPRALDIAHLTWCDHLVVHTADFGGPTSLHPDIPQRTGELLVRRRLVEDGIQLMRRLHMIDTEVGENGIAYAAADDAPAFVASLRSGYLNDLKARAHWLATFFNGKSVDELTRFISERIGRWAVEFHGEASSLGNPS